LKQTVFSKLCNKRISTDYNNDFSIDLERNRPTTTRQNHFLTKVRQEIYQRENQKEKRIEGHHRKTDTQFTLINNEVVVENNEVDSMFKTTIINLYLTTLSSEKQQSSKKETLSKQAADNQNERNTSSLQIGGRIDLAPTENKTGSKKKSSTITKDKLLNLQKFLTKTILKPIFTKIKNKNDAIFVNEPPLENKEEMEFQQNELFDIAEIEEKYNQIEEIEPKEEISATKPKGKDEMSDKNNKFKMSISVKEDEFDDVEISLDSIIFKSRSISRGFGSPVKTDENVKRSNGKRMTSPYGMLRKKLVKPNGSFILRDASEENLNLKH